MPNCESCSFSTARPRVKLVKEKWEEDPRPIRSGWKATWWNPRDYKDPGPYWDDDYGFSETMDKAREIDNQTLMYCDRYPERVVIAKTYICGEYQDA